MTLVGILILVTPLDYLLVSSLFNYMCPRSVLSVTVMEDCVKLSAVMNSTVTKAKVWSRTGLNIFYFSVKFWAFWICCAIGQFLNVPLFIPCYGFRVWNAKFITFILSVSGLTFFFWLTSVAGKSKSKLILPIGNVSLGFIRLRMRMYHPSKSRRILLYAQNFYALLLVNLTFLPFFFL